MLPNWTTCLSCRSPSSSIDFQLRCGWMIALIPMTCCASSSNRKAGTFPGGSMLPRQRMPRASRWMRFRLLARPSPPAVDKAEHQADKRTAVVGLVSNVGFAFDRLEPWIICHDSLAPAANECYGIKFGPSVADLASSIRYLEEITALGCAARHSQAAGAVSVGSRAMPQCRSLCDLKTVPTSEGAVKASPTSAIRATADLCAGQHAAAQFHRKRRTLRPSRRPEIRNTHVTPVFPGFILICPSQRRSYPALLAAYATAAHPQKLTERDRRCYHATPALRQPNCIAFDARRRDGCPRTDSR